MGKSIDYVTTVVAIWRLGAVHVPLFTAFASPAIAFRLEASHTKAVVCDDGQRAKLDPGADIPADTPAGRSSSPAPVPNDARATSCSTTSWTARSPGSRRPPSAATPP